MGLPMRPYFLFPRTLRNAIPAVTAACLCLATCGGRDGERRAGGSADRIVSLVPSATEILFAVGCGDRVVGVTDYCAYPPEATALPRVGGYLNPSYEQLLSLRPSLVVLMREHNAVREFLDQNSIAYLLTDNTSLSGIAETVESVGSVCSGSSAADSIARVVRALAVPDTSPGARPRMLLCVGRQDIGSGSLAQIFAAGAASFYQELMAHAGARNVLDSASSAYPMLSIEAVMRLDPEIIVDVVATMPGVSTAHIEGDWQRLTDVTAVREGRVLCLSGSHVTIPGPRLTQLAGDLRDIVRRYHDGSTNGKTADAGAD